MTKLKEDFEASGGVFKEWRIDDIFLVKTPKRKFNANAVTFGSNHPYVVRTSQNNGVRAYLDEDEKYLNDAKTISFGQDTATMFYQEKPYFTGDKIKIMKFKDGELTSLTACYLLASMYKSFSLFSWGTTSFNEDVLNSELVNLPTFNNEPSYFYMEQYISLLEEEKMLQVDKFLKDSGLNDTSLTAEETAALEKFRNGEVRFEERKIGDLFEKVKLGISNPNFNKKTDLSACKDLEHPIPVINAKIGDNGIMYWAKQGDFETISKCIDVIQNGAIATGKVYAQPQETGVLWDSYLIKHVKTTIEDEQLFFFTTVIEKSIRLKFYYDCKAYWNEVKEELIMLPCTLDNSIDYTFMETYVKAIEKQCIARLKTSDVFVNSRIAAKQTEPTDKVENIRILVSSSVPVADRFSRFLPLYPFHIACGALESGDALPEDDIDGWIDVSNCGFKINEQMFLVHAKGESMLPKIHPGDLCLFEKYGPMYRGGRDGNIVLVRQSNMDDDYGCQYTIKEFYSEKDPQTGRTIKVELRPLNQKYPAIEIKESDQVDVIAVLKCVL